VWLKRVTLETLVGLWLGGRIAEWAATQEAEAGVDEERALLARDLDLARAGLDRVDDGRRTAARQLMLGVMSEDEYAAALADVDAARRALVEHVANLELQIEALAPDADVSSGWRGPRSSTARTAPTRRCGRPCCTG
jgi:hypothetical protein